MQERLGEKHFEKGAARRTYRKEMDMLVHPGMTFYRLESLDKADREYMYYTGETISFVTRKSLVVKSL